MQRKELTCAMVVVVDEPLGLLVYDIVVLVYHICLVNNIGRVDIVTGTRGGGILRGDLAMLVARERIMFPSSRADVRDPAVRFPSCRCDHYVVPAKRRI